MWRCCIPWSKKGNKKKFGTGKEKDVSALENNTRKSQDTGSTKLMEAGGSCRQCRQVKRLASAPYKPWKMTVRQVALFSVSTALVTSHKYLLECQLFSHLPLATIKLPGMQKDLTRLQLTGDPQRHPTARGNGESINWDALQGLISWLVLFCFVFFLHELITNKYYSLD